MTGRGGNGASTAAAALLCVSAALWGCGGGKPPVPEPASLDAAEAMLTEAALRAETALTRLSRLEADPEGGGEIPRIVPGVLLKRVDLEWIGPAEEAARKLAAEADYRFETAGAAPARPVMVELRARNRPLIMVLRDVGLQAGAAAALTVDGERGLVVLDWTGGGK